VGWSYFDSAPLPRILQPHLQQITGQTGEAVYASVLDGWDLVFIARNGTSRVMTTGFVLGARVPAQLASPGIVMLGALPEAAGARVAGHLCHDALHAPHHHRSGSPLRIDRAGAPAGLRPGGAAIADGVRGIAVPLKNRHAKVVGALSLSFPLAVESQEQTLARAARLAAGSQCADPSGVRTSA
jgi:IclR family pca regulon transcriptional regulator